MISIMSAAIICILILWPNCQEGREGRTEGKEQNWSGGKDQIHCWHLIFVINTQCKKKVKGSSSN